MGLDGKSIRTWDDMKQQCLIEYPDYGKSKYVQEGIFKMIEKEDDLGWLQMMHTLVIDLEKC